MTWVIHFFMLALFSTVIFTVGEALHIPFWLILFCCVFIGLFYITPRG